MTGGRIAVPARAGVLALAMLIGACTNDGSPAGPTGDGSATAATGATGGALPAVMHVTGATVTPTGGGVAVLAFSAHNAGGRTDTLVEVTCACGGNAVMLDADGEPVTGIDVAPDETVFLGPGSPIVELRDLGSELPGDSFVAITATFELAGDVLADALVASSS